MSTGSSRTTALDPSHFMSLIESLIDESIVKDEVCIRRIVSALYFCLFNYWAARKYELDRRRGRGTYQDRFSYRQFHEELLGKGLDKDVVLLYTLRTASDHYVLNPTIIEIQNKEIITLLHKDRLKIHLTVKALKNVLNSSKIILKSIQG